MNMDQIDTELILDAGAKYINSNHPDNLAKRIVLGQLLVNARFVSDLEAAFVAFRTWSTEGARAHGATKIISLSNEMYAKKKKEVR